MLHVVLVLYLFCLYFLKYNFAFWYVFCIYGFAINCLRQLHDEQYHKACPISKCIVMFAKSLHKLQSARVLKLMVHKSGACCTVCP